MSKRLLLVLSASLWLSVVVCGQALTGTSEDQSIFGLDKLHRVTVSVTKSEWDVLQTGGTRGNSGGRGEDFTLADGRIVHVGGGFGLSFPWVHGDLLVNGKEIKDAGIRYKGNNSFVKPTPAKPFSANLKVKTDLFGTKEDWEGEETLNFHAGARDPSLMRETLAYAIFRAAGVPAPRTAYAELTFNVPGLHENAPGGVYTVVENVNKRFLKRALPPGTGLLMKPEGTRGGVQSLGPSWASYVSIYRPERDATPQEQQRVLEFTGLISQPDVALFREKIGAYLDVDLFLRFLAVNLFIANGDSYIGGNHNYYLYLDPKDDKFRFLPWDLDLAMGGFGRGANAGPDILRPNPGQNALIYWLMDDPAIAEKYRAIVKELAASVFTEPVLLKMLEDAERAVPNRDKATRNFLISRVAALKTLVAGPSN
jgi:spore coat protein H